MPWFGKRYSVGRQEKAAPLILPIPQVRNEPLKGLAAFDSPPQGLCLIRPPVHSQPLDQRFGSIQLRFGRFQFASLVENVRIAYAVDDQVGKFVLARPVRKLG